MIAAGAAPTKVTFSLNVLIVLFDTDSKPVRVTKLLVLGIAPVGPVGPPTVDAAPVGPVTP